MVYDAQLIFGGKHRKYQFGIDDYVFASLSLYLDIINLFLIILGGSRRN
jgi:protein lifeguard